MTMTKICTYTIEEFEDKVRAFHGFVAPGIIIGGFMVDLAYRHLPVGGLYDAISETAKCLPDAIQLLTPCTIGNGWLRITESGRYALIMYHKRDGEGVRVYVDAKKLDRWPVIKSWFFRLEPKEEQSTPSLLEDIKSAGVDICSYQKVKVNLPLPSAKGKLGFAVCPQCGEGYPSVDGSVCLGCQGKMPYTLR
jgi:formylmethanofuran dehydrogenase subunit E